MAETEVITFVEYAPCFSCKATYIIIVYGSMSYVGIAPKWNGGDIKNAQMTH